MLVILFGITIFLSINLSRLSVAQNNNTLLKTQLQRSLSHINDMLADIEDKIEDERKVLSQIDYDLNLTEDTGFMDYEITDIWWQSTPATAPTQTTKQSSVTTTTAAGDGDIRTLTAATRIIPTSTSSVATPLSGTETTISTTLTSPLIPKILPSTTTRLPPDWPFATTPNSTDTPFVADLKKVMAQDRYGYFTSFLARFLELVATKDPKNVTPIIKAITAEVTAMIQANKLQSLGKPQVDNVKLALEMVNMMAPSTLQQQAGVAHYVIKNKQVMLSKEANAVFDYYDSVFTQAEGEALFASLELFDKYPDGGKNANEVAQSMLKAIITPFQRLDGTVQQQRLMRNINQAIQDLYPHWRAFDHANDHDLHNLSQGKNNSIPLRRSMNYKKIMRHFLIKHPKLFKKLKRRHKHIKKKNHHRTVHKQRRHNFHRRHVKHGHLYEQLLKKRAQSLWNNNDENIVNSGASEAFYHEQSVNTEQYYKINKQKMKRVRNQLHARHRNGKPLQQQHRLYKPRTSITHPKRLNAKYLKELAIKFIRNKHNGNTFRRFNIESSEHEMVNESVKLPIVDNNILHKITEASSYTDEEDNLKINLYDALRHGNRTYYQFRSNDANNQTMWNVSIESDDEWIIKNNIYKVFE